MTQVLLLLFSKIHPDSDHFLLASLLATMFQTIIIPYLHYCNNFPIGLLWYSCYHTVYSQQNSLNNAFKKISQDSSLSCLWLFNDIWSLRPSLACSIMISQEPVWVVPFYTLWSHPLPSFFCSLCITCPLGIFAVCTNMLIMLPFRDFCISCLLLD